jgi:murein DD-endopeptidase MepM/ murein hydrolase activator NlpD
LALPNDITGWVRDDLLEISGDATRFGYKVLFVRTFAFSMTRDTSLSTPVPAAPAPAPIVPPTPVSAPVTPAPAPVGNPAPPAPAPVITAPAPTPNTSPAMAIVQAKFGASTRSGPGLNFARAARQLGFRARHSIVQVQPGADGFPPRWMQLSVQGELLWVREDLVRYEGATQALGLADDLYAPPMRDHSWWVRGFNAPAVLPNEFEHLGWDLGADTGQAIFAGAQGGQVMLAFGCRACQPGRPNGLSQGLGINDPRILNSEDWGFGYGNYVIVRYAHEVLPVSTQQAIARRGLAGGAIYVIYAHLETLRVQTGQRLMGGQLIGTCGNTGNSEATHLHLELRVARAGTQFTRWAQLRPGLMDPVVLFQR